MLNRETGERWPKWKSVRCRRATSKVNATHHPGASADQQGRALIFMLNRETGERWPKWKSVRCRRATSKVNAT
ncbi:hypothetical protein C7D71_30970, partial [Klebsiella pneumoniae]